MEDAVSEHDHPIALQQLLDTLMIETRGRAVLNVHGVAAVLNISLRHTYELMRRRRRPLPYIQAGRVRRVPVVLLAEWMLANSEYRQAA